MSNTTFSTPSLPIGTDWTSIAIPITGLVVTTGLYLFLVPNSITDRRRSKLPPGPKGWPIIGNLFDFSDSEKVRGNVISWAHKYGDVFYTKMGGTDYVWLSSPKAVKDLLDKKSAIYSSRPYMPLAQDVASGKSRQLFMAYGPEWRGVRKHSHTLLNQTTANSYRPIQDFESKVVLHDLLEQPDRFVTINRRYTTSVIMLVTYGYRIPSFADPLITKIFTVLEHAGTIMAPGAFAVESFPSLTVLPEFLLGNWYSWGKKVFAHDSKVYLDLWEELKRKADAGEAPDCFCKDFYLADPEKNGIDNLLAAFTCGGLIEAGSETTATTIINWILAMLLNPAVLKKAQNEMDRVVGSSRLPTFEDEADLPYLRAMIKETLRWRPLNKYGMYHASTADDWYEGHFIPKDSVVVLNWWAIHRNPELYEDPESFSPDRFLSKPLAAAEYININDPYERDHFAYGAGRRVCPGVHLAERSLFIVMARTLWGFNITKSTRADGSIIEPTTKMVPGFFSSPEEFECDITVRSSAHEKVIRESFSAAQDEGLHYRS
ncbi:cytochrome P450 [Microdochium bolleyi]|uniref:Cytochrome P450 n=1 Tax=Microdochium bolleyi TaxID=196109 RepID=A0A136ISI8_9PEZI|nr:cytochrome P450 [Microdochium bolleyi]